MCSGPPWGQGEYDGRSVSARRHRATGMYQSPTRLARTQVERTKPRQMAHRRLNVMSSDHGAEKGACHSCGSTDEDVIAVHRMYVVPEDWDTKPEQSVQDDIEMWCFSCRTHYPHVLAD